MGHVPIEPIPLVPVTLPLTLPVTLPVTLPMSLPASESENGQLDESQETQKSLATTASTSPAEPPPPQKFKKLSLEDQRYYVPIFHVTFVVFINE